MKKMAVVALFCLVSSLSACAAAGRAKGVDNTFLTDVDVSKKLDNMHFNHSWVWAEVEQGQYHSVIVKPVRLDFLPADSWKKSISAFLVSKAVYDEKAKELAAYFQERLILTLKDYPDAKYKVVDQPGPGVVVVEIALTQLEFSHPITHAGAIVAPVPGAAQALATISDPHAAFALRLTDSETNSLIATAADRKYPPIRIFDLNKVTISSSLREICSNWSKELSAALNEGRLGKVPRHGIIKLLPF